MLWRSIINDPPSKTRRYIVANSGGTAGNAYYTAKEGDTHYPVGWAQVPDWGPTHWLDFPAPDFDETPRFWNPPKVVKVAEPTKKHSIWKLW